MKFLDPSEFSGVRFIGPTTEPFPKHTVSDDTPAVVACPDLPDCPMCLLEQEAMAAEAIRRWMLF